MPKRKKVALDDSKCAISKIDDNSTTYKSLIENVNVDEITYFNGMPHDTQMKIIDDLSLLKMMSEINTPYRIQLLNKPVSFKFKIVALKKINVFEKMDPCDGRPGRHIYEGKGRQRLG